MPTLEQVFCKFGEVAEAAQLLETDLGTMMLRVKGIEHELYTGDKGELATEIYKQINKSTLGQLLKQVAKPAGFSDDLELLLAQALQTVTTFFTRSIASTTSEKTLTKAVP